MTNFASTDQLKAIWKGIGEAKKIDAFFIQYGKGLEGAQRLLDALNKGTIKTVEGVSRGGAEIYRALARDYVANMDPVKYEVGVAVQATRAQIIEKAAELGLLK